MTEMEWAKNIFKKRKQSIFVCQEKEALS